eukprot:gene16623-8053_t
MDIVNPLIVAVGGRRYRKLYVATDDNSTNYSKNPLNEICAQAQWEDEQCDDEEFLSVRKTADGYIAYCTDIPSYYFKFICGRKNESKSRIEKETKTHVSIPRPGREGDVVITGPERSGVLSARSRVNLIVESARGRARPTHFISIPLACAATKENFEDFKSTVLQDCRDCKGFSEEIIQVPEKLHITMGVMALMSEQEIGKAAVLLKDLQDDIQKEFVNGRPLRVVLNGIECMNDDPSQVVVLYAKVKLDDGTDRLQRLADFIVDRFSSAGLMRKEYDKVKLHATVINTNFISAEKETNDIKTDGSQSKTRRKICDNFNFGMVDVTSLHLSKRGQYGPDGFYHSEAQIEI